MSEQAGTVKAEMLAKFLMISPRHLQRLVADGWVQKDPSDRYTVVGGVQGYIRYLKDENRRGSQAAGKNRTADARAREIELRIQKAERTVIPFDEAVASMNFAMGAMRAEMEGTAANITRDRELRHRIQDAHDGILKRAAERIARECAALRSGVYAAQPDAADESVDLGEE